jgi:hypothetical protein
MALTNKNDYASINLKRKNTFRSQLDAFNNVRIYVPYAALALITGAIAVLR